MFCKYCGKKIDKNSKFCEFCGRPIGKSDSKKINLEKDEDLVYIDSHDSTEFNDYDFDNVDDFSYEENFNYNQRWICKIILINLFLVGWKIHFLWEIKFFFHVVEEVP